MLLGLNWHKDVSTGMYREIFIDSHTRATLGTNLNRIIGNGYIRYPGGKQAQEVDISNSFSDPLLPDYKVFYSFCRDHQLKVIHQLPTCSIMKNGSLLRIKLSKEAKVNWQLVDSIIESSVELVHKLQASFGDLILFWEFGNEDYALQEGPLTPSEYVDIIEKYLIKLNDSIPSSKILVAGQTSNKITWIGNWGLEVLRLLKTKGLISKIGGATVHIYPFFMDLKARASFSDSKFDFDSYCLSESLITTFIEEFTAVADALDNLGYSKNVKVHITEMAVDIPDPLRQRDKWPTFQNNRKNYAAAVGVARILFSLTRNNRFGSATYHCIMERYLVASEKLNPTKWKGFTTVSDWGFGQMWYLPERQNQLFVNTPLLELWGLIADCIYNAKGFSLLNNNSIVFVRENANRTNFINLLVFNSSPNAINVKVTGTGKSLRIGDGNLNRRAIRLGSSGSPNDITPLTPVSIAMNGNINLPPYSVYCASGDNIVYEGIKLTPKIIAAKATLHGNNLALNEYSIHYIEGVLVPKPRGSVIHNYPLEMITGLNHLSVKEIEKILFGETFTETMEWSINDEQNS